MLGTPAQGYTSDSPPAQAHRRGAPPAGVATLVGREEERARARALLAETRLLTFTGAGGCGKTRLAVAMAADAQPRFADGVRWVELAGVGGPGMVATAIGGAVGVRERPGQAMVATLVELFGEQESLLVLDNCEHLLRECAQLVSALLQGCQQLTVLATSRELLAVEGEVTLLVPPLAVPPPEARSAEEVAGADAARLFALRARQAWSDFALTDENAQAVGEICRRLDGIPLAVELAAARVRVLTPAQIAAGLSDRFGLLARGQRDTPARQQTLEASVAWSYDLLGEAQRLALAQLSVFAGTFDLEAAQAVVAGEDVAAGEVLDLVTVLAERSLLQVGERDGVARYRLLETIRAYAGERLAELDDPARVRDRHLDFYAGLTQRAGAGLTGPDAEAWTARLAADLDDLRAAMDWAVASGRSLAVLDIVEPTVRFWFDRGWYSEIERRLHAAIDAPAATDTDRARGWGAATLLALGSGYLASAYEFAGQAVAWTRTVDAEDRLALALAQRAYAGILSGRASDEVLRRDVDEAVAVGERLDDDAARAYMLMFAGITACYGGTLGEARHLLEQVVALGEDAEVPFHLPAAHSTLAAWPVFTGEVDRCREHARRGVELSRQIGRPGWECVALLALALADLLQGKTQAACEQLADVEALLSRRALPPSLFELTVGRFTSLAACAGEEADAARERIAATASMARDRGSRFDEAWAAWLLGLLALDGDHHDDARGELERCRSLSTDPRYPFLLGRSLVGLADLAEIDGDPEGAWTLAHEGLEVLATYGDRVGTAEALEAVAGAATVLDRPDQALRLLAAVERFHDETGVVRFPLEADRRTRHVGRAHAALDGDQAECCWAEGLGLSLDEAVAYARRGRGERGRPQAGWASLTPAERQLVRLVTEGLTNVEIGERLFVSANTVKKHLSHVYAKLDVNGRAELAAEAARHEP